MNLPFDRRQCVVVLIIALCAGCALPRPPLAKQLSWGGKSAPVQIRSLIQGIEISPSHKTEKQNSNRAHWFVGVSNSSRQGEQVFRGPLNQSIIVPKFPGSIEVRACRYHCESDHVWSKKLSFRWSPPPAAPAPPKIVGLASKRIRVTVSDAKRFGAATRFVLMQNGRTFATIPSRVSNIELSAPRERTRFQFIAIGSDFETEPSAHTEWTPSAPVR